MAELTQKERLQPSLLDRLTDDNPLRKVESREQRVMSGNQLRDCVRRDLSWLFNTTNWEGVMDLSRLELVRRSTLNYGIPDLTGQTLSSVVVTELERTLRQAIWDFEPRLVRNTVKVKLVADKERMDHNAMAFVIEAQLWAQPMPMQLYLRTEIDLEDGSVLVTESGR